MAFSTIEALAAGRAIVGQLSGPQIVEVGTDAVGEADRARDNRRNHAPGLRREGPVSYEGEAISYQGLTRRAWQAAQVDPAHQSRHADLHRRGRTRQRRATAEIADGWLPMGLTPSNGTLSLHARTRRGAIGTLARHAGDPVRCGVRITNDVGGVIAAAKPQLRSTWADVACDQNFHKDDDDATRYGDAADRIQELFLAGKRGGCGGVPDEYVDEGGLFGSPQRIRERLEPWTSCGITGLTVTSDQ
jgi:hypothetical protein